MDRKKIDNALQNERKKYLEFEDTHDIPGLESLYLKIAKETPEDLDSQPLVIAMEECGELSQAIAKGIRGKADVVNLAEEIADVSIIIDYVKATWNISDDDIKIIRALKLEQLEGIVNRLHTEHKTKLSDLSMMDAFTTLKYMTYDSFFKEYRARINELDTYNSIILIGLNTKIQFSSAFVDAHWEATSQITENGLTVLRGTMETMKTRAHNLASYMELINNEPAFPDNYIKVLWSVYQIDVLIWIIAMTFRRFSVLNAWVGNCDYTPTEHETLDEYVGFLSSNIHALEISIAEFIDYAEYNGLTVTTASNIRKVLNDALSAVINFENKMFNETERNKGETATWIQLGKLIKMMRGDDFIEERRV